MKYTLFWFVVVTVIWVSYVEKESVVLEQNFIVDLNDSFAPLIENKLKVDRNNSQVKKSSFLRRVVVLAKEHIGKPYVLGEIGPESFDCSGFVYSIYKQLGMKIPRTSLSQSQIEGRALKRRELSVGDIVFFDTSAKGFVNHSGIYIGEDKFIHASSGKAYSVTISEMNGWYKDKFKWGKHLEK